MKIIMNYVKNATLLLYQDFLLFHNRTYIDRITGANLEKVEKMLVNYENMLNSRDNN